MKKLIIIFIILTNTISFAQDDPLTIKDRKILDLKGRLSHSFGEGWEDVIAAADELIQYKSERAYAYYEKAYALTFTGRYKEAITHFDLASKHNYPLTYIYHGKAECFEKWNMLEEALKYFNMYLKMRKMDLEGYSHQRKVLLKLGRINKFHYENAGTTKTKELWTRLWYSIADSKHEETIKVVEELIKYNPGNNKHVLFEKARALTRLGKYAEALSIYDKLYEKEDKSDLLNYERGLCLEQLNRFEEAEESFYKAIECGSNPYMHDALERVLSKLGRDKSCYKNVDFEKARALVKLGKYQEALDLYELAHKKYRLEPCYNDNSFFYYERGICLEQLGRLKEAHESLNLAFDQRYWNSYRHLHRWTDYDDQGDVLDAIDRVLLKLSRVEDTKDNSHISKIKKLESRLNFSPDRGWEDIIAAADELIKYKPQHAKAHFVKAEALARLGYYKEAIPYFDLALEYLYPYLGYLYYERGRCLEALDKLEEALKSYNLSRKYGEPCSIPNDPVDEVKQKLIKLGKFNPNSEAERIKKLQYRLIYHPSDKGWNEGWENVIAAADELISFLPRYGRAYYEKGRALGKIRRDQEAIICYDLAVKYKYRWLGGVYYEKGLSCEAIGKLEEALASYDLSIKYDSDFKWAHYSRYQVLDKLGRPYD